MKRWAIKVLAALMALAMLTGPALGEALEGVYYRIKSEIIYDKLGEVINYLEEITIDEDGCIQETVKLDMGDIDAELFFQIGEEALVYSLQGGEAREINYEVALKSLLRAVLISAFAEQGEQGEQVISYLLDGGFESDIAVIISLMPAELTRFIETALSTEFMSYTETGFVIDGTFAHVMLTLAAYMDALAADAQVLAQISSLNIWALTGMPRAQLALMMPELIKMLAINVRAEAETAMSQFDTSRVYLISDENGLELNIYANEEGVVATEFNIDATISDERVNVSFGAYSGVSGSYENTSSFSLDLDLNARTCYVYLTHEASTSYSGTESVNLSLAYLDGEFSLSVNNASKLGNYQFTMTHMDGEFYASLYIVTGMNDNTLDVELHIDAQGLYARGARNEYGTDETCEIDIKRVSAGVYTANVEYDKLRTSYYSEDHILFRLNGALDLNARTLDMTGRYADKSGYGTMTRNDDYTFGAKYANRAFNAYLMDGDDRADLSFAIAGENGVYGANLLLEASSAEWGDGQFTMLSADLSVDCTKDALPVFAFTLDMNDIDYEYDAIKGEGKSTLVDFINVVSSRTVEDGFTLTMTKEGEVFEFNAKSESSDNGGAIHFSADVPGAQTIGEIGYTTKVITLANGTINIEVCYYAEVGAPSLASSVLQQSESVKRFEVPCTITISPGGAIDLYMVLDMGEQGKLELKGLFELLPEAPAHVHGTPYTEQELAQFISETMDNLSNK